MDAFYVSVHLLDHPEDAGIPLAVGGKPTGRGVVTSASYEARAHGVRSAMPMGKAVRICQGLKVVPADWPRIRERSRWVMEVMRTFGPIESMSVDEAYIDLSDQDDPEAIALKIPQRVQEVTGLPCSIGLATNKLVAKVASDHDKPNGRTIVPPGEESAFLAPLSTRAIWGIGPRTAERLMAIGIETCAQLAEADPDLLARAFKNQADSLRRRALGRDEREVHSERGQAKSISNERTFGTDRSDAAELAAMVESLAEQVARRVQKKELQAGTVFVKFRWADFTTFTRQRSLEVPVSSEEDLRTIARTIWDANWPEGQIVRLIGVGVSGLSPAGEGQLTLWG